MGQQEILEAVNNLKFTTLEELRKKTRLTDRSINDSLSRLEKWKEITTMHLGVRTIYLSQEFLKEIALENE